MHPTTLLLPLLPLATSSFLITPFTTGTCIPGTSPFAPLSASSSSSCVDIPSLSSNNNPSEASLSPKSVSIDTSSSSADDLQVLYFLNVACDQRGKLETRDSEARGGIKVAYITEDGCYGLPPIAKAVEFRAGVVDPSRWGLVGEISTSA